MRVEGCGDTGLVELEDDTRLVKLDNPWGEAGNWYVHHAEKIFVRANSILSSLSPLPTARESR